MKRVLTTLASLALVGSLAACGSGGGSNASGSEITVYFIGTARSATVNFPEMIDATKARVAAANAAGGINGKKIKFVACNDGGDPNEASACARRAYDAHAVAVIGGITTAGDTLAPALAQAGIVYTGYRPFSPAELATPIGFPLVGGGDVSTAGGGINAAKGLGCKNPFVLTGDTPITRGVAAAFDSGYKSVTGDEPKGIVTPATTNDYSAAASAAVAAHADCVYVSINTGEVPKVVPTFRQTLPHAKLIMSVGLMPPPTIKALGAEADGIVLFDTQIPVSTPNNAYLAKFNSELTAENPKAAHSTFALSSWMGTDLLVTILDSLKGDITSKSVLAAYQSWGKVDGHGAIGDFSFGKKGPISSLPRAFNATYTVFTIVKGVPTVAGGVATFDDASSAFQ